ncbi:hypothetical protein O0I10_006548 [Lichtheimia ornata]|uniref:t-SNARE coiled-coil homology domain-containing protein n=1 Tax=Lichtheimia ornata TaxID=688661 RepID=A0AAD7V328_9FUNG|nr:uncharacterized protein O0I10_006548 [Lichtheimia ornata]KAJ8657733.1 hypothetical protein O0I10_006548 [Lichtheimia ornata]
MAGDRYTISRDRMADLRASTDSTEAFGPRRGARGNRRSTSPRRHQSPTATRQPQQQASPTPSPVRQQQQRPVDDHVADLSTMDGYLSEVGLISDAIDQVKADIERQEQLHSQALESATNDQQATRITQASKVMADQISDQNNRIKRRIQALMSHCGGPDGKIRHMQAQRLKQDFVNVIQQYQNTENTFSKRYRQQVARQIRIVKPDVTEEEIDAIMDSDQQNQVFAQSLLKSNRSGQAQSVLSQVQTRHDDIKRIEKTLLELHQLFVDMQTLVEHQGNTLTEIEDHAETAAGDIEKGVHHVDDAIKIAKRTRAKKWCCFIIVLILLIVAAFLIWWFAFNHKGVGGNP